MSRRAPVSIVETIRDYVVMAGEPDADEMVIRCVEHLEDAGYITWTAKSFSRGG